MSSFIYTGCIIRNVLCNINIQHRILCSKIINAVLLNKFRYIVIKFNIFIKTLLKIYNDSLFLLITLYSGFVMISFKDCIVIHYTPIILDSGPLKNHRNIKALTQHASKVFYVMDFPFHFLYIYIYTIWNWDNVSIFFPNIYFVVHKYNSHMTINTIYIHILRFPLQEDKHNSLNVEIWAGHKINDSNRLLVLCTTCKYVYLRLFFLNWHLAA